MDKNLDTIIAVGGALAAVFKWVWEYTKKLQWEKDKFLLEELEKFQSLETTIAMETILDWNAAKITLNNEVIKYNDDDLYEAFMTHNVKKKYTTEELRLRGLFDDYFDGLTRLIFMAKSGLISEKKLKMFMQYWISILNGKRSAKPMFLRQQIIKYLEYYSYDAVLAFIK